MKRIKPRESTEVYLPRQIVASGSRSLTTATALLLNDTSETISGCLACPDEPCRRFSSAELSRHARVETPYAPDDAVCPTDALTRVDGGLMTVDESGCIGCGLCVVRCPVGAIWINADARSAVDEAPGGAYDQHGIDEAEFLTARSGLSAALTPEEPPFVDASLVVHQVTWAEAALSGQQGQRALRRLVRNSFLLDGSASRLKNAGDNNAFSELAVDDGRHLVVIEIEPGGDLLDALRRAVAGCAVAISRYGVDPDELVEAIVMNRLPNERVDYYEVVQNVRSRLGLLTYTVPLAVLLLAIRGAGIGLTEQLDELCWFDDESSLAKIERRFGEISDAVAAGLATVK
jgi:ferredoxin